MTFSELERAINSKKRKQKEADRNKAQFDYTLADLIGRSVARVYNSSNNMPTLSEAYPSLFDKAKEQEAIAETQDNLSAARFRQFAESFNRKYKEAASAE